jgi:hypothetical protein
MRDGEQRNTERTALAPRYGLEAGRVRAARLAGELRPQIGIDSRPEAILIVEHEPVFFAGHRARAQASVIRSCVGPQGARLRTRVRQVA